MWYCELRETFRGHKYLSALTLFNLTLFLQDNELESHRYWHEAWSEIRVREYDPMVAYQFTPLRNLTEDELKVFVFVKLSAQDIRELI